MRKWDAQDFTGRGWCGHPSNDQKNAGAMGLSGCGDWGFHAGFDDLCQGGAPTGADGYWSAPL